MRLIMTANELADELVWIAKNRGDSISRQLADIVRQQQAEIEALKKQIPDWENINKPNPFIGWEKSLVAVDSNPNSGLGGIALKKASEK